MEDWNSSITDAEEEERAKQQPFGNQRVYKHPTISQDQSKGSDLTTRALAALDRRTEVKKPSKPSVGSVIESGSFTGSSYEYGDETEEEEEQDNIDTVAPGRSYAELTRPSSLHTMDPKKQPPSNKRVLPQSLENNPLRAALDGGNLSEIKFAELREYISALEEKVHGLHKATQPLVPTRHQILYKIESGQGKETQIYLDHPQWAPGGTHVEAQNPIRNFELFLERNRDISFVVFRHFNVRQSREQSQRREGSRTQAEPRNPPMQHETIYPVAKDLVWALDKLLSADPEFSSFLKRYRTAHALDAPYLFLYHGRAKWSKLVRKFQTRTRERLERLADYVFDNYHEVFSTADKLLHDGEISPALTKYLFKPGEVVVSCKDGNHQGYMVDSWPAFETHVAAALEPVQRRHARSDVPRTESMSDESDEDSIEDDGHNKIPTFADWDGADWEPDLTIATDGEKVQVCTIECWRWEFDGSFKREKETLTVQLRTPKPGGSLADNSVRIDSLDVYPLRFASDSIIQKLQHRGKMFWHCRKHSLVSYQELQGDSTERPSEERYMIDFKTFRTLHSENRDKNRPQRKKPADEINAEAMNQDTPPDENFQYLLPPRTKGYNLRRKKWYDLEADRMLPVKWNKKAFETLVIDRKSKDLIQALVSKQVATEKATDLIAGKGNGLILLLHGGPGTGKTLTAESVAEIAEKPLYRVTCGDVGTKAEEVEQYLESVLHLGKIWDCVVLLDEADVFLEQRTLEDLQRNALVSVLLRVLEYHEGILILTSNRVGTFDEAFRSRIQLALHYPSLRPFQCEKIWQNFFDRLRSFNDNTVDVEDLEDHLEELAKIPMNGREIRNTITTARQYAEWKGKLMKYEHLQDVIKVSGKFDDYLKRLRGGLTGDQLAEDEGIR